MKKNIEAPGFILPGIEDITRRDFLVASPLTATTFLDVIEESLLS